MSRKTYRDGENVWINRCEFLFRKHQMPTTYSSSFIGWSKSIYSSPINTMFTSPLHPLIYKKYQRGIGFTKKNIFDKLVIFYIN